MLRLLVEPAQGESFEVPLEGEEMVVGRSADCDLTIEDRFLSRRHARLFRDGDGWRLEDLESRNGTLLSGRPVDRPLAIAAGDEILLSNSVLRVDDPAAPRAWPIRGHETATGEHTVFHRASELLESQATVPPATAASAEVLQSHAERLQVLNEVHQVLARSLTVDGLLDTLLDRAFELLRPEEGVIVLRDEEGGYHPAARRTADGDGPEQPLSATLTREVIENGKAALALDVAQDDRFADAESIMSSGVRSLIAAPMADADGPLGMIALSSRLHRHRFEESDLELLTSLGAVAALRLRNLELVEEAAERRRLEDEVRLARSIQVGLLPAELPEPPGWELHAATVPSQGVSGDFYEAVESAAGDACTLVVTDVSGKGIGASLLTASIEALLAGPLEAGTPPDRICAEVSQRLWKRTPPAKYATAFLATLDPVSGELTWTNAGHNPGLIVRAEGTVETLDSTGPPIGLLPGSAFESRTHHLAAGDLLVLYTDGITEACDPAEEEFGLERLRRISIERRHVEIGEIARAIDRALVDFTRGVPFADDRTLLLLRRRET